MQPELSVDFGVSSGILYVFKFHWGLLFILKPAKREGHTVFKIF